MEVLAAFEVAARARHPGSESPDPSEGDAPGHWGSPEIEASGFRVESLSFMVSDFNFLV